MICLRNSVDAKINPYKSTSYDKYFRRSSSNLGFFAAIIADMHERQSEHARTLPLSIVGAEGDDVLGKMTFRRLFNRHGPLVAVEAAIPLLGFRTRGAFNKAIEQKRLPIHVIRPEGRKQSFVATQELASYLARLAGTPERGAM